MVIESRSSCSTSFSHTAAPRWDRVCRDLVSGRDDSSVAAGRARAARGNDFATAGGNDMVMRLFVGRVSTDIDGKRDSCRVKRGGSRSRRVSVVPVRHLAGIFARRKSTSERENPL
jgi:hypothetical protein